MRRLLLLDRNGNASHVVVEVLWGNRWIVADPSRGQVFKDRLGRALTRDELRQPEVFRDAITRMPGYPAVYSFERTEHVRLQRIPVVGHSLRRVLDRFVPDWEERADWAFLAENPPLWLVATSILVILMGLLAALAIHPGLDVDVLRVELANHDARPQRARLIEVLRHAELQRALRFGRCANAPVAKQRDAGVDVVSDGEMSKTGFSTYVNQRFSGFEGRSEFQADDVADFPDLAMRLFTTPAMAHLVFSNCVGPAKLTDKQKKLMGDEFAAKKKYEDHLTNISD